MYRIYVYVHSHGAKKFIYKHFSSNLSESENLFRISHFSFGCYRNLYIIFFAAVLFLYNIIDVCHPLSCFARRFAFYSAVPSSVNISSHSPHSPQLPSEQKIWFPFMLEKFIIEKITAREKCEWIWTMWVVEFHITAIFHTFAIDFCACWLASCCLWIGS